MSEKNSTRSYRWVRIWLGVGVVVALLLLGNSVRDYFFVARFISIQQVRHQVSQHVVAFENNLRTGGDSNPSRLKVLTEEWAATEQKPVWIVLHDPDGAVLERIGTPERTLFTPEKLADSFRNREALFDVIPSSRGEIVVEVYPVRTGQPGQPAQNAGAGHQRPPFVIAEIAMPLSAADSESLWPIRRNLMINIAAAIALLLTAGLTAAGFRSYVHGKQLEQQVEIAREVQANLLPRNPQLAGGIEIAVEYEPAEGVAGDFYDTFSTGQGPAFVIGDVSGKGIPAALLMGVIHGAVRSSAWTDSAASHERQTTELNQLFCERASGERFASLFWSYCDPENRAMHYVNAGHCPPMLIGVRQGKVKVQRLDAGGPVLGVVSTAAYAQGRVEIRAGDIMVLYSDGLIEATNAAGEEFGESRLAALLLQCLPESPKKICDAILSGIRTFLGNASTQDDLTFVVAKFGAAPA